MSALELNCDRDLSLYWEPQPADWRDRCNLDEGDWYLPTPEGFLPDESEVAGCLASSRFSSESDASDSIAIYRALNMLTPDQAADHRLWVGLSHFELYPYVRERWGSTLPDPSSARGSALRTVRLRWFVANTRVLVRDNAVSRLWWMGRFFHLAAKASGLEPEEVGSTLSKSADVRDQLFGRPASVSNVPLLAEITRAIRHDPRLIDRLPFRRLMVRLNQLGGAILIDGLSPRELRRVVRREAKEARKDAQAEKKKARRVNRSP